MLDIKRIKSIKQRPNCYRTLQDVINDSGCHSNPPMRFLQSVFVSVNMYWLQWLSLRTLKGSPYKRDAGTLISHYVSLSVLQLSSGVVGLCFVSQKSMTIYRR